MPTLTPEGRRARLELEARTNADLIEHMVNGMDRDVQDALETALANMHPTLLGQLAKVVGVAVMRRSTRDPKWRPYDALGENPRCEYSNDWDRSGMVDHSAHDGRLACKTVIGAELMARQSLI